VVGTVGKKANRAGQGAFSEKTLVKFMKEHLSKDYPNPRREGCPPKLTLERLAKQPQQVDPSVAFHVFHCSPCYKECRRLLAHLKAKTRGSRTR
jgi:hypothetical protein